MQRPAKCAHRQYSNTRDEEMEITYSIKEDSSPAEHARSVAEGYLTERGQSPSKIRKVCLAVGMRLIIAGPTAL